MSTTATPQVTPKRSEVPLELTWDLSPVYTSAEEWEADYSKIESQIPAFAAFAGQLGKAGSLLECLSLRDDTGQILGKLYSWASLRKSEDNGNSESVARYDRVGGLYARWAAALSYIEPEILSLPEGTIASLTAQEAGLQLYAYYFETMERRRPHTRSAEVEEVLAQLAETRRACEQAFRAFDHADLKFPKIKDENGVEQELTHGKYITFLQSTNREVREAAFKAMHGTFHTWRNTMTSTLSGTVKSHVAMARIRKYPSFLHLELQPESIPTEVYTNLLSTVRERLPVLHRYLRLRKKMLGLEELRMWDLYVPIVAEVDRAFTYDQGKNQVLDSVAPLGDTVRSIIQKGFEERWVDVLENEGKTSGAFSDGSYLTPPYMLLNWQDKLESVFTLAHEWGHSLHSYLAREAQPYIYADYTIFVAEVASTLLEALLSHSLLQEARTNNDVPLQLYLLNQQAERFRTTLYRQTLFAEFELKIHEVVERNEALTADLLSEIYLGINKDYYGAEVNVDDIAGIEWARIPHFYYGYYVYQYATGISAAQALARQILKEGQPAVDRYLNFLRGGGSDTSINLLKGAGVDMTTPEPVNSALDIFDETIAEMEKLAGK